MSAQLLAIIGGALIAAGNHILSTNGGDSPESAAAPGVEGDEAPKRRGRPPGSTNKPPETTPATTSTGPTDAERLTANLALIEPVVKSGKGEEVKSMIRKHSPTGLKDLPADKQTAFERDLDALTY